jgi:diguanylate cyclase (GGDEF)-like protein
LRLNDRLTEAIALGRRRRKSLAVCFLDIDGFKAINDSVGHAAADEVLRSVAARLTGALRLSDTVSRYAGDEFVIVLSEIEHAYDVDLVATTLLQVLGEPHRIDGNDVTVTASLGLALYPEHGQDAPTLMASADLAMYDAKRAGLGHYQIFNAGMRANRGASPDSLLSAPPAPDLAAK